MSTPGKVLVVLATVLSLVWAILVFQVTLLGNRGRVVVKTLRDEVADLENKMAVNQKSLTELKDRLSQEQIATQEALTVIRARLAEVERARSETLEIASRVQLQGARLDQMVQLAKATLNLRRAEKEAEIKAKAAAEREVVKLQGENSELMNQLTNLRDDFTRTLNSNKEMVERLLKAEKRPARRASLAR